jgi:alkanesulfonate monooxygenase SsuD/methylene tetrahydromethanopterin reductase-like flavin-dependent oxidoreductase (luciferase family)
VDFELRYSLSNPSRWERPWSAVYDNFLEQVAWADRHGFTRLHLSEHHFVDPGWCPAPLTVAAAVAACTTQMKICVNLALLPLRHPVHLAEEATVIDLMSKGRLELILGAGYRQEEFDGYGVAMSERGSLMDEAVQIIRACWEEEEFDFSGRHWNLECVRLTPKPFQQPHPLITLGGSSVAAAKRAARLADAFAPVTADLLDVWRSEMLKLGKDPDDVQVAAQSRLALGVVVSTYVATDPVAAWRQIGPHVLEEENPHLQWVANRNGQPFVPVDDCDELIRAGLYKIVTPAEAIAEGVRLLADQATARPRFVFEPMKGGLPFDVGQHCLELVVSDLMPALIRSGTE